METIIEHKLTLPSIYATGLVNDDWSSFDYYGTSDGVKESAYAMLCEEFGTDSWHCVDVGDEYTSRYVDVDLEDNGVMLQMVADFTFHTIGD